MVSNAIRSPARTPDAPAFLSPFFLTMKLVPMKTLEESASTSPLMLSVDIPVYDSTQLPPPEPAAAEVDVSAAMPPAGAGIPGKPSLRTVRSAARSRGGGACERDPDAASGGRRRARGGSAHRSGQVTTASRRRSAFAAFLAVGAEESGSDADNGDGDGDAGEEVTGEGEGCASPRRADMFGCGLASA